MHRMLPNDDDSDSNYSEKDNDIAPSLNFSHRREPNQGLLENNTRAAT